LTFLFFRCIIILFPKEKHYKCFFGKSIITNFKLELKTMTNNNEQQHAPSNKLPLIGFFTMLSGPAIIFLGMIWSINIGNIPLTITDIIIWITILLPGIGAVLCIISLCKWKKIATSGRVISIITVVMCNPAFYYIYFIICLILRHSLAGLSWM
jgi:hypothetical protein